MNTTDVQRLLAAAGYYRGAIDGDPGRDTIRAVNTLLDNRASECTSNPGGWPPSRRLTAAGQLVLKYAGYDPGEIDGLVGNRTTGAFMAWNHQKTYGRPLVLEQKPVREPIPSRFPAQSQARDYYGEPGSALERRLVKVPLPFPFRIDWDLGEHRTFFRLHEKCAASAERAINRIAMHYGREGMQRLGLDRFAGDYNHRRMRGGSSWSMHAFGCAIDFYAQPNGLTTRCPQALFCRDVYQKFFDIWEDEGWTSLGRAIGRDWMHVQAAGI